jgi:hypothetical protein
VQTQPRENCPTIVAAQKRAAMVSCVVFGCPHAAQDVSGSSAMVWVDVSWLLGLVAITASLVRPVVYSIVTRAAVRGQGARAFVGR